MDGLWRRKGKKVVLPLADQPVRCNATHDKGLVTYRRLFRLGKCFQTGPVGCLGQSLELDPPESVVSTKK